MTFRANYLIRNDINTYLFFILFFFLFIAIISSKDKAFFIFIGVFILLILLLSFYRLIVYRYGEKVIIINGDLIIKKIFANPKVFRLSNIHRLSVVKLYRMYGNIYCIVINIDVKSKEKIVLTENNSFMLEGGWSDKEIIKLVDYIKVTNTNIQVGKTMQKNLWHAGSLLKRTLF